MTGFVISLSFIALFLFFYNFYIEQKEKDLHTNINMITETSRTFIDQQLSEINLSRQINEQKFYDIHRYAQEQYLNNPSISLEQLKSDIKQKNNINDFDIDVFLIDASYTVTDATFKRDIGFNLKVIEDAKYYLDKTSVDSKIYVASNVSIDFLEDILKVYSYSKIGDGKYFEIGFKSNNSFYKNLQDNIDLIAKNTNNYISLFRVNRTADPNYLHYENLLKKPNDHISKQEYYETTQYFDINKPTTDKIINVILLDEAQEEIQDDRYISYIKLLKDDKEHAVNEMVFKIDIDISEYQQSLERLKINFTIAMVFLTVFLMSIYYFVKFNFYNPVMKITHIFETGEKITDIGLIKKKDEFGVLTEKYNALFDKLKKEISLNLNLLKENKRFIADTVHQIRTPLTNIMMNAEMVKRLQSDASLSRFIDKIDSSINMLSNSYEDLAYVITADSIQYPATQIDVSEILADRIRFFLVISEVNHKPIRVQMVENLVININLIELERLIDNNLSNAIKYADKNQSIKVELTQQEDGILLSFASVGEQIKHPERVFEENYRENEAKRGLGLGLNMVKGICDKNHITYHVSYQNHQNIFTYCFKDQS